MAARGKKPESNKRKRGKGISAPSKLMQLAVVVDFPKVSEIPDAPEWLINAKSKVHGKNYALEHWKVLTQKLFDADVIAEVDVHMLAHLCMAEHFAAEQYEMGLSLHAASQTQLRQLYEAFGLSPASRTRVGKISGKSENKFNTNRKKKT